MLSRKRRSSVSGLRIDPESHLVVRRFAIKLALLFAAALPQATAPWGFKAALAILALASALIDVGIAMFSHDQLMRGALNYCDEAIVFVAVAVGIQLPP